ncbi:Phage tail completion protein [Enterobacter hormaechei]|nr:Phage tail completion protein [Enterobacter hormaechei]
MDDWLGALLANLEPAARNRMMRQLAQELRRSQQKKYQAAAQSRRRHL